MNRGNDRALFVGTSSSTLEMISRQGSVAPGTNTTYDDFAFQQNARYNINDSGRFFFYAPLGGPSTGDTVGSGLWTGTSAGDISLVTRTGDLAPGTEVGTTLGVNSTWARVIDNNGQVIVQTSFSGPDVIGYPDPGWNYRGVYLVDADGNLTLIARDGDPAPGTNEVFGRFPEVAFDLSMNDAGRFVIKSAHSVNGLRGQDSSGLGPSGGIWFGTSENDLELLVKAGDLAPQAGPGTTFSGFVHKVPVSINNSGQMAFISFIEDFGGEREYSIWAGTSAQDLSLIARPGDQAPGMENGVVFVAFAEPVIGENGLILVRASLEGPGVDSSNNTAMWMGTSANDLMLVAREGDPVPGSTGGETFWGLAGSAVIPVLNSAGQLVFTTLTNPDPKRDVICVYDSQQGLQTVLLDGDLLEVAPGDFRTVVDIIQPGVGNQFFWSENGGQGGQGSPFSDSGQLVFHTAFTDGTAGIFLATIPIPEPGTFILVASAIFCLSPAWMRRRRLTNR